MSVTHPEPEVRELALLAQQDDDIEMMVIQVCRHHGCANLTELFDKDSDLVFELHDEVKSMLEQLPDPVDETVDIGQMLDSLGGAAPGRPAAS